MSIRDAKGQVLDQIPVKQVLLSVFDKDGLEELVPAIAKSCPGVRFISTGGTYKRVAEILEDAADEQLIEVAEYTGAPEMEGGLVKTLHPLIHGGILAERGNPDHEQYLSNLGGDYIDMVVVNLYPFGDVSIKVLSSDHPDATFETARGNIDIGGPCMLRAAAKNFIGCCPVVDPADYGAIAAELAANDGSTTFNTRFEQAKKVFHGSMSYESGIHGYLLLPTQGEVRAEYGLEP